MRDFLFANLFLLAIVSIGAAALWLVAFTMWSLGLPPDDNPLVLMVGCVAALFATYYLGKWLHAWVQKRI